MDTPNNSPTLRHRHQGPARDSPDDGVQALASSRQAQEQAAAFWVTRSFPAGDPRRALEEQCSVGLCGEGGDFRPWNGIQPGEGAEQGSGLGPSEGPGSEGPVLGDSLWHAAQVRRLWEMSDVMWGDLGMDTDPAH